MASPLEGFSSEQPARQAESPFAGLLTNPELALARNFQPAADKSSELRSSVDKTAGERFTKLQCEELRVCLDDFKKTAETNGTAKAEIDGVFRQVLRIISPEKAHTPLSQRLLLAQQLLGHAMDPPHMDQGAYNTCMATAYSKRLFKRHPSQAAEMITSAALDGSWRAPDGKLIHLDEDSLRIREGEDKTIPADGARTFAMHLFTMVMINDIGQRHTPATHYILKMPGTKTDSGERNLTADGKTNPTDIHPDCPDVTVFDVIEFNERMTGEKDSFAMFPVFSSRKKRDSRLAEIHSQAELKTALEEQHKKKNFPIFVLLNGYDRDLLVLNKDPSADKPRPIYNHGVAIMDYDAKKELVYLSDNRGHDGQRWVPLATMFATFTPDRR